HREVLPVAGGRDDRRPARRGRDRRRARAAVSADRRHHDVVRERTRGPADAERRRAAGRTAAVGGGAMEPDDERSRTGLCHVALARGRAAHGTPVAGWLLAGVVRAVALVERAGVAVGGAGRPARLLAVGGAGAARARAGRGGVTLPRRGAAGRARIARRVLAGVVRAVALVEGAR